MIIIQMAGGLGNQMFQYAAAKALAKKSNAEVAVDVSGFKSEQLRNFDLSQLNTQYSFASESKINELKAKNTKERIWSRLIPYAKKKFYKQPYFHFDAHFFSLNDNIYLKGYFQSEKFFEPVKDIIRKEFTIKHPLTNEVINLGEKLKNENSVSVHIRRGDYNNPVALQYHGILPITYYTSAISHMQKDLTDLTFYVFTDDHEWVAKHLSIPDAVLLSGNVTRTHFEDLYLMTQCRHNIIANSSFSWWGAWLGEANGKKVIAPKKWFNKGPNDTQDLIPSRWLKI